MSDQDTLMQQVEAWLEPLGGDDGPCGADLEYDNAFLELNKAAEGKPGTQFDEHGTPPDWRGVREQAEDLFGRTRDLRIALLWLRAMVNLEGVPTLVPGLRLVNGLLETLWDSVHPMPDPSDNDPYARANALAMLPSLEGLLGDLLGARLVHLKGLGEIRLRAVEVAMGNLSARDDETAYTREQLERMLVGADQEGAGLRAMMLQVQASLRQLGALMDQHFGSGSNADLKPLLDVVGRTLTLIPEPEAEEAAGDDAAGGGEASEGGAPRSGKAGLSGGVNSRAEAVRAIEMVCAYLERHEPTNPAQLFLRRANALLGCNFLELLKELAPNALDDVARIVGVDPNTIGESEQ